MAGGAYSDGVGDRSECRLRCDCGSEGSESEDTAEGAGCGTECGGG